MATANQIQQLYIAYFSRPADLAGLNQWLADKGSLNKIAQAFGTSPEFNAVFAPLSVEQQVNQLYINLFSRSGSSAELRAWTTEVINGRIDIAQLGLLISNGARGTDLVAMNNKIISATSFTDVTRVDANALLEYSGNLAIELTIPFLAPVTAVSGPASPGQVAAAINNLPPVGSIGILSSNASSVTEGDTVIFTIATALAEGSALTYTLSGVLAADVVGGVLTATVFVDSQGTATVPVTLAEDALVEVGEVLTISIPNVVARPEGSDAVFVIDTLPTVITQAVLTTSQDISGLNIAAPTTLPFTYFANEETLGQSDQLSLAADSTAAATLSVGTAGSFELTNFSTNGIETLEILPSGEFLGDNGFVDLQAAIGLLNINVSQSALGFMVFEDIQSAQGLTTNITDSFSDFEYNFDANALLGTDDLVSVVIEETPIDAGTGEAVSFGFSQGPFFADADLETLLLTSNGAITNVVNQLSVGDDLSTLIIDGNASLDITEDLGLFSGNRRINLIDASFLGITVDPQDLSLSYTSILGDVVNNSVADVTVLGATGINVLTLGSQATPFATDFFVRTQAGNDSVTTGDGADSIVVAEGNNFVSSSAGNDTIIAGAGNDGILAGADNDVINAGNGLNSVEGGLGNDSIITGDNNDVIVGDEATTNSAAGNLLGAGNDTIRSGGGADSVFAGSGANLVESGSGDDTVLLGEILNQVLLGDTFANTVLLGDGNDALAIDTNSLTNADSINGGAGIDTVRLNNGGTIGTSETLRVSRIEAFDLRFGGGDYSITLSNELVATADDDAGIHIFSVLTSGDAAANVTLDLSYLSPVVLGTSSELLSIRYSGQADTNTERVIIRDGLISDQTRLAFEEAAGDADETFADVMQIVDSADVTKDDLIFVTGLEVIELASSVNGPQTFTFDFRGMTAAEFNALVGDGNDFLIIRATPLLAGAVSQLNLNLTGATFDTSRIIIEQSADLNVSVVGGTPVIRTALFYTPNADNLLGTAFSDTFTAYQLSDVQAGDNANGLGATDILDLRFAVSNSGADLLTQLNQTSTESIEIFDFNPAAVNQSVQFNGIGGGVLTDLVGLSTIFTAGGADLLLNIERSLFIDTDSGNDTVSLAAQGTVVTGFGNDSVVGSAFADSIVTGEGADTVDAGAGADFVDSGLGDDSVVGGIGNDTVDAGNGNNTVSTGLGNDSVVSGIGNDSINTAAAAEALITDANDTVSSGAGNDSIFVGLGDDSVVAGDGDDLIVLGFSALNTTFGVGTRQFTGDLGGFSTGDSINGGDGFDTVVFGTGTPTAVAAVNENLSAANFAGIEQFNITFTADNDSVTLASNLTPIAADGSQNVLTINLGLAPFVNPTPPPAAFLSSANVLDASAFVQGQAVKVTTSGNGDIFEIDEGVFVGPQSILGGAGNDQVLHGARSGGAVNGALFIQGNGGADSINLAADAAGLVQIAYATGNDGGTGGSGIGGDLITGFAALDTVVINGTLVTALGGAKVAAVDNGQLALGTENILSLTGPARSLLDSQLTGVGAAAAIAANINGSSGGVVKGAGTSNSALIVQQGQTDTALYLYTESSFNTNDGPGTSYTVEANELRQLGIFDNALFNVTAVNFVLPLP